MSSHLGLRLKHAVPLGKESQPIFDMKRLASQQGQGRADHTPCLSPCCPSVREGLEHQVLNDPNTQLR